MTNPICPEPDCKHIMRLRHLKTNLGILPCPNCKGNESKKYVLTINKQGLRKCMQCRKDFKPKRREGMARFWVCRNHPWQKFKVGAEVIICKGKPKSEKEIRDMLKPLMVEQARERRQNPRFQQG